ncbi:MAG: hypothetical protein DI538_06190 [Azospira oryzae]|nr:MAG: hypothetical protein DI538_06190 [Azospira oryzae]
MPKPDFFLLFLAEAFGFGPISSSIAVARKIKIQNPSVKCLFAGCGTAHQLAVSSDVFDEVHFSEDISSEMLLSFHPEVNTDTCLVIANTYPGGVRAANQAKIRCIFIDTLFWMWNSLPIELESIEKYYLEDFRCIDINIDRFGPSEKYQLVPPLVDIGVPPRPIQRPMLLVSLGGIDSPLYDFPVFYERLIEHISSNLQLKECEVLVCGGGKKIRDNSFKHLEHSHLTITCLPPQEYMSYLKSADLVLASAGLHSFYENYYLKKNVLFLPPQTFSQYLQLKYILANFENVVGTNFEQLDLAHTLRENMEENERISEVKRTNLVLVAPPIFGKFLQAFEKFQTGRIQTDWATEKNRTAEIQDGPAVLAASLLSLIKN